MSPGNLERAYDPNMEEGQDGEVKAKPKKQFVGCDKSKPEGAEDGEEAVGAVEAAGDAVEDVMEDVPGGPGEGGWPGARTT